MLLVLLPIQASANEANEVIVLVEHQYAMPGDYVYVDILITENPGIISLAAMVHYDDGILEWIDEYTVGAIFPTGAAVSVMSGSSGVSFLLTYPGETLDVGAALTIRFRVRDSAAIGDSSPITITQLYAMGLDSNSAPAFLPTSSTNGSVTVTTSPPIHEVIFHTGIGGTFTPPGDLLVRVESVQQNTEIGTARVPDVRPNRSWIFDGWRYDGQAVGTPNLTSAQVAALLVTGSMAFTAQWRLATIIAPPSGDGGGIAPDPDPLWRQAFLIGTPDGLIRPQGNITRAEVATIFFRLIEDSVRVDYWTQTNPFDDVTLNRWFNNAISTTTNMELFTGIGDNQFAPDRNITRGELAAVLVRFMDRDQVGAFAGGDRFNDIAGHWARAYVNEAARQGWVQGYTDGTFRPNQPITRAETAAMINRMFERLIETAYCRLYDMVTWPDNQREASWYFLYMYMAANSYTYQWRSDSDRYKELIEIIDPREWWRLERPDSRPYHILG